MLYASAHDRAVRVSQKRREKEVRRAARKSAGERQHKARVRRDAAGRAHLIVHRDALGRPERLSLARSIFAEPWQDRIATAAASTAFGLLSEGRTPENAAEIGRNAMEATSTIISGLLARSPQRPPECRSGCTHCCYQAVGVSAPEVFAIYEHLQSTCSPEELEARVARIRSADEATRGKSSDERFSPELPCPFLDEGRCSIYEVRPLACRGKNSLDAEACERTLHDPDARAALLAGSLSVPCYLEPIRAFHAVAAGLQLALHELCGLRMLPLELTAALRILLDDPEVVPERWLAGEDPFAAARGGDATSNPKIAELSGRRVG